MKSITISTGELNKESNLPKGRQVFINGENRQDLAVLLNWETDVKKFEEKEKELKKLAKLYVASPLLKQALEAVLNNLDSNGNVVKLHKDGKVLAEIRKALQATE